MAVRKYLKNNAGTLTEEAAVNSSAGASDEGKIPALNASGVLAASIVNSVGTSAGAGDSGKLPSLDGSGKLDNSFMPVGIGADTAAIATSETLAAGDFVNIWGQLRRRSAQGRRYDCWQGSTRLRSLSVHAPDHCDCVLRSYLTWR